MKLKNFKRIVDNTPGDTKEEIKLSMDILDRIHELLDEKFEGKQKLLALKLGKSEAEISKWLSGVQNFTIKTLVKLQIAFGEPIIAVCTNHHDATFTQVMVPYNKSSASVSICPKGKLEENFQDVNVIHSTSLRKELPV